MENTKQSNENKQKILLPEKVEEPKIETTILEDEKNEELVPNLEITPKKRKRKNAILKIDGIISTFPEEYLLFDWNIDEEEIDSQIG